MVEDDEAIRELLASAMRFAGYGVESVSTGADALQSASRSAFDLIVLDVGLPDIEQSASRSAFDLIVLDVGLPDIDAHQSPNGRQR